MGLGKGPGSLPGRKHLIQLFDIFLARAAGFEHLLLKIQWADHVGLGPKYRGKNQAHHQKTSSIHTQTAARHESHLSYSLFVLNRSFAESTLSF
jgi:hypothetical protein